MIPWILAGLGLLSLLFYLLRYFLIQGQEEITDLVWVDGKSELVSLHFGSKLPKVFGHQATFAGKRHLCFRSYPLAYPVRVVGVPSVSGLLVAHEIAHHVDRVRKGFWRFWTTYLWELRKPYKERPTELYAYDVAPLILENIYPDVDAKALLARVT